MFLNKLCGWLIIEKHVADDHRQDHSNEESLHGVRQGGVTKSSRGAPSRGGGGGLPQRGRGFQNNFGRSRGNQPNFGRGRGNQSNFGRRQGFY
ncbi:hypothetical protein AAVH_11571 [Aphelenchoides avenae]|nr:hypothetical protein AAVH_11571 [Aphelenchus avenae]